MKNMNMKKRYWMIDLQVFAEGDEPGGEGGDSDDDDDSDSDDDDEEDDADEEKKFSQKDVDDAVKKRLAREKRKWQRAQQKKNAEKNKPDDKGKVGDDGEEDKETKELRDKAAKADDLELKWTCLEHDVDKSCVDDVLALAKVHMAKDEDMDIEDAIDEVLKKYPQFKNASSSEDDDPDDKKSWGQRHNKPQKKNETVEDAIRKQLFGK